MSTGKMSLPGSENVSIFSERIPRIMDIADPPYQHYLDRLTKEELGKLLRIGIKYQTKLIGLEIERLNAQSAALAEMQKMISGFK